MVKVSTAAGIAGMWFIAWQLFRRSKGQAAMAEYEFAAHGHKVGNVATPLEICAAQEKNNGRPAKLLNVSAFTFANLEGEAVKPIQ